MKFVSKNPEETRKIAQEFLKTLRKSERATVVGLYGDLGTGKTAFSQFLGEALGVHDPIQSPTFLIEKIYELKRTPWEHLVHIDAYRLESSDELLNLGWREIIKRPENLVLVEWADRVKEILPENAYHIAIKHVEDDEREIHIEEGGEAPSSP